MWKQVKMRRSRKTFLQTLTSMAVLAMLLMVFPLCVLAENLAETAGEAAEEQQEAHEVLTPDMEQAPNAEEESLVLEEPETDGEIFEEEIAIETEAETEESPDEVDAEGTQLPEQAAEGDGILEEEKDSEEAAEYTVSEGQCGKQPDTVYWELNENGVLRIYGTGRMADWETPQEVPWYELAPYIMDIRVEKGVTSIGSHAFSACINIRSASVG